MIELYKNIKSKRIEKNMSQSELAEKVGYSGKSMISKIERGEIDLPSDMISKFAIALDTTSSELMGDVEWKQQIDEVDILFIKKMSNPVLKEVLKDNEIYEKVIMYAEKLIDLKKIENEVEREWK